MNRAIAWARDCLDDERTCVIDLETTGINDLAEPVEVAVVDREGRKVLYTRTRALALITPEAQRVSGLRTSSPRTCA